VNPVPDPLLRRKFGSAVNRIHDLWATTKQKKLTPWLLVRKRTTPIDRPPRPTKSVPTFVSRGCCVVRAAVPHGGESRFSRQQPLLCLELALQLSSQGLSGPRSRPSVHFTSSESHYKLRHRERVFCAMATQHLHVACH
jgi:hypothetical protein